MIATLSVETVEGGARHYVVDCPHGRTKTCTSEGHGLCAHCLAARVINEHTERYGCRCTTPLRQRYGEVRS